MTVSIIIANYNYGHVLSKAIESVLGQTYADWQLIIVDDGSTDHSREVIDSFKDPRISSVFQENSGQGSAFNTGWERTSGDIVCFLDSDDWWKPEKLTDVVKWDQALDGDYGVLQHNLTLWRDGNELGDYVDTMPTGNRLNEFRKTGNPGAFIPTTGLTFRRKILEKVMPIPDGFRICADAFITRAAMAFGPVVSIPKSLGFYRKHTNSVYENDSFKIDSFLAETALPALNAFYEKNDIDCRFRIPDLESAHKPTPISKRVKRKLKHLIKSQ